MKNKKHRNHLVIGSLLISGSMLIYSGCNKNDSAPSATSITFSPKSLLAHAGTGEYSIKIISPAEWIAGSTANWIDIHTTTGLSEDSLIFFTESNTGFTSRAAYITVTSGDKRANVIVTQEGLPDPCVAGNSTSYFPIAQHYFWTYHTDGSYIKSDSVSGTQVYGPYTFQKFVYPDPLGTGSPEYVYRRAATNGNVYQYNLNNGQEYLEVPGSPSIDQKWAIYGGDSLKVISVNDSITTPLCSYDSCLQINEYLSNGTLTVSYHYKKGIGLVKVEHSSGYDYLSSMKVN